MDLTDRAIGLWIEGIPADDGAYHDMGALFYYGEDPSSLAGDYGLEHVLTKVPADLSGGVDLQRGGFDLSASTVSLSATQSVCRRLMVSPSSMGSPPAKFSQVCDQNDTTVEIYSGESFAAGDVFYSGNETFRVQSVVSSFGNTHTLNVHRGYVDTAWEWHGIDKAVYFRPPTMKLRRVQLVLFDLSLGTSTTIWNGLLTGVTTNDQQTEVKVKAAETLSVLWGSAGGDPTRFTEHHIWWGSDGATRYGSTMEIPDGIQWVNDSTMTKNIRVGDVAYAFPIVNGEFVIQRRSANLGTTNGVDADDNGDVVAELVERDAEIRQFLAWSNHYSVANDFEGVFGVDQDKAHPAAVALALMLSTGSGGNDAVVGGTTYTFDKLGSMWSMGVPVGLIDVESWVRIIEQVPMTIDTIVLGWDGEFKFEEVILKRLLLANNLLPFPTSDGRVGLRHVESWKIDDISEVVSAKAFATLTPKKIRLDRRLEKFASVVKATIGGAAPEENPDEVRLVGKEGFRRNSAAGQTPYTFDLTYRDKDQARNANSQLHIWLEGEREKRQSNPPVIECEVPFVSHGGEQQLPPLGHWVKLKGGPETGLIGPDGDRVWPDTSNIIFIGILTSYKLDLRTFNVSCEVLLTNWWTNDRLPRLIAPSAKIEAYDQTTGNYTLSQDYPNKEGWCGFLEGDEVKIVHADGRRWYGDNFQLTVEQIVDNYELQILFGLSVYPTAADDLYLELRDYDQFWFAAWEGSTEYATHWSARRYAFMADAAGNLGNSNDEADIYS